MPYKDPEKQKEYNKQYRLKNKERANARMRERRKTDPVYAQQSRKYAKRYRKKYKIHTSKYYFHITRNYLLKKKYGITLEQYSVMLEAQGGVCYLCGRTNGDRSLAVDHNHKTGRVRKLLCGHCNYLVGTIENSKDEIKKIEKYLDENRRI